VVRRAIERRSLLLENRQLRERLPDGDALAIIGQAPSMAARHRMPAPPWSDADMLRWQQHDWPGNVRELKNVAERVCLQLADGLEPNDGAPASLAARLDAVERGLLRDALRSTDGNVAKTAELLQLPKTTLYDKLQRHGIVAADYAGCVDR
jgi:two-component system C4-dicarboxylate transport response regulator DctD